jgi:hypothetical protein
MAEDTRLVFVKLKSGQTHSFLAYYTQAVVSEMPCSDKHPAYLPLFDLIPPLHEVLHHIEHTWAGEGHMCLIVFRQHIHSTTIGTRLTSCQGIRGVSKTETVPPT